ncbi:hypothetical protein Tco_0724335, partial [Tanacetum coccineum]
SWASYNENCGIILIYTGKRYLEPLSGYMHYIELPVGRNERIINKRDRRYAVDPINYFCLQMYYKDDSSGVTDLKLLKRADLENFDMTRRLQAKEESIGEETKAQDEMPPNKTNLQEPPNALVGSLREVDYKLYNAQMTSSFERCEHVGPKVTTSHGGNTSQQGLLRDLLWLMISKKAQRSHKSKELCSKITTCRTKIHLSGLVFTAYEEPVKPMKKKHQISFDEEVALKLTRLILDEEERLNNEES